VSVEKWIEDRFAQFLRPEQVAPLLMAGLGRFRGLTRAERFSRRSLGTRPSPVRATFRKLIGYGHGLHGSDHEGGTVGRRWVTQAIRFGVH
jgi:hypothetical protein